MTVMTKMAIGLAATALLAAANTSANAQSLEERIAAVKRQRAEAQAQKRLGPNAQILQKLFYATVSVDFQQLKARDALNYLKTVIGVNMIVRYADDPVGHGIDPETLITLDVTDLVAVDVLDLVLEQCETLDDCTWQLRNGYIEVGTKDRLSAPAARVTRVYPVHDLLYRPPRFDEAPPMGIIAPYTDYGRGAAYGYQVGPYSPYYFGGSASGGFASGTPYPSAPGNQRPWIDPTQINSIQNQDLRGQKLLEFVSNTIEPTAWAVNGGDWATIAYVDGTLVVNAPDFIQRQIGGYPRIPPPAKEASDTDTATDPASPAPAVAPATLAPTTQP
jgi:hypothetical protein